MFTELTFTAAEVCKLLGVSKSTLLRWERDGVIAPIKRGMGANSLQRNYTQADLRELCRIQRDHLYKKIKAAGEDDVRQSVFLEALYVLNFIEGKPSALLELKYHPQLSAETLRLLLSVAPKFRPSEQIFADLMEILFVQSRKLSQPTANDSEVAP